MLPNRILYQIKFCSHKKDNYGIHFSYYGYDLLSLSTYHKTDYFPDLNLTLILMHEFFLLWFFTKGIKFFFIIL